jgi:hypothetical protein
MPKESAKLTQKESLPTVSSSEGLQIAYTSSWWLVQRIIWSSGSTWPMAGADFRFSGEKCGLGRANHGGVIETFCHHSAVNHPFD